MFVDSSAFYAAADEHDVDNARARGVLSAGEALVTTDHVLLETWALLRRRLGRAAAEAFWGGLRSGAAAVEAVLSSDLEVAWAIGQRFSDQDFSLADRSSFAVMHRLGLSRVATLDDDFAIYRYGPRGEKAFEVVR